LLPGQPVNENSFQFKPVAASLVGLIKGNPENLPDIVNQLNSAHFKFEAAIDIQPVIWTKAIVNSVFNSICPLLETDNGIFHRNESALNIAREVIAECINVSKLSGVSLDFDKVLNTLLLVSKSSEGQLISTYQDIKNKRRTEIETLNFAFVNIANEFNVADLLKGTKLLGELIFIKSELTRY